MCCRPSSLDLTGTEVILAGELAWLHCTKSTYHHRHAKGSKSCLIILPRVQDKGRSRTAVGDDQTAFSAGWDRVAVLGNVCSEAAVLLGYLFLPSLSGALHFHHSALSWPLLRKMTNFPSVDQFTHSFLSPWDFAALHSDLTSSALHLLIASRAGGLKENGTPANLRCEGFGSMVLVRAVASACLFPNSVVKSAVVPNNTIILSSFALFPLEWEIRE